jgi:cytochrome c peroxidase
VFLRIIYILLFGIFAVSCQKAEDTPEIKQEESLLSIPEGFPMPEFPEDNPFTEQGWQLGKKLFFDTRLSKDQSVSCASCHLPEKAFSDTVAFSLGFEQLEGTRNAPTLANAAYHPYYTREGGIPTLEMQVLVPIQEHNEFNFNILEIVERLSTDEEYLDLSLDAYDRELDYFVLPRAIATFERSMISGNSKYDRYINGKELLTELETSGLNMFESDRTNCSSCHSGFNFTSYEFANTGLYSEYNDPGRFRLTGDEKDIALFKVPTLRNIELSGPYMHDGSFNTLEEVIEHYNSGGKEHINKSELIAPLALTNNEKSALIAFLKTLTDYEFINNEKFRN